ncbi:MAG: hypothetical protein ACM3OO_06555 [Planctomycetaceae bacterium]
MRLVRSVWIVLLVSAFTLPAVPAGAGGIDRGNDRGVFVNAGWDVVDPETGTDAYLVVEASAPADPRAPGTIVSVFGSSYRIVDCDGFEALWSRDVGAEGTGSVVVAPRLSRGTLVASLDLTISVRDPCAGTTTERVRHDVPIRLALRPTGPVRHDSGGSSQLLPSLSLAHQHIQVRVRAAAGPVVVGASRVGSGWGEFGRIHGVWQVRARSDAPAILLQMRSRVAAATQHERVRFASATDERYGRRSLRFLEVDAVRSSDGTPVVSVWSYRSRTLACPDGSEATLDTTMSGDAPGRLRFAGHFASVSASAMLELMVVRANGCTGGVVERTIGAVPVTLSIAADGPFVMTSEWITLRTPSEADARVWTGTRSRSASGSFTVGGTLHAPTTWAAIGEFRARAHGDV